MVRSSREVLIRQASPEARSRALERMGRLISQGAAFESYASAAPASAGIIARLPDGRLQDVTYRAADILGWDASTGEIPMEGCLHRLRLALRP